MGKALVAASAWTPQGLRRCPGRRACRAARGWRQQPARLPAVPGGRRCGEQLGRDHAACLGRRREGIGAWPGQARVLSSGPGGVFPITPPRRSRHRDQVESMGPGQTAAVARTAGCPGACPGARRAAAGGATRRPRRARPATTGIRALAASMCARAPSLHEPSYAHRKLRYGFREEPWLDVTLDLPYGPERQGAAGLPAAPFLCCPVERAEAQAGSGSAGSGHARLTRWVICVRRPGHRKCLAGQLAAANGKRGSHGPC